MGGQIGSINNRGDNDDNGPVYLVLLWQNKHNWAIKQCVCIALSAAGDDSGSGDPGTAGFECAFSLRTDPFDGSFYRMVCRFGLMIDNDCLADSIDVYFSSGSLDLVSVAE